MGAAAYATPTLQEEIDRKSFATIEWLTVSLQQGKITESQFSTGIDSLFMAVAGLANGDILDLITEAQGMCNSSKAQYKRHFHAKNSDEIRTFCWSPGDTKLTTVVRTDGLAVDGKVSEYGNAADAAHLFKAVGEVMTKKGWIEL